MAFCCALPLLRSIWLAGTEKISLTEPPYGTDEGFLHRYGMSLEDLESLVKQRLSENAIRLEEDSSDGETIGLAVGETFSTDVILVFSVVRHSTQQRDAVLQEAARTQLRISESNSQQVAELFKDLSARLVSIHTERDCFVITFKTVEEIWKFSSHLALGHVAHSLENFLFDQTFWLDTTLINDVKICVSASEEHLATVYLGLLLQEGSFYAKALVNTSGLGDEDFSTRKNDLMLVRNIGLQNQWEGMVLSTGRCGLVPVEAVQPLSYPFYQWFLKTYPGNAGCPPPDNHHFPTSIGTGSCIALVDSKTLETDELSFKKGDRIEVLGFLLSSLDWFVGKNISTGKRGFVQKKQVEPVHVRPLDAWLLFVSEDEMKSLTLSDPSDGQGCQSLLGELLKSDISTVYRLNRLAGCEFPDVKNKPKPEDRDSQRVLGRSPSEKLQNGLRDDPSKEASPCSLPGRAYLPCLEDTFQEMDTPEDDPRFLVDLNTWDVENLEAFDPLLTYLNQDTFVVPFLTLYDLFFSFLKSTFYGFSEEEDLVQYLECAREWARRSRMLWALRRICFLLGRLCAKKLKFSQARVYFEESLAVSVSGFADPFLLSALYVNLAAIYLKQKNPEKLECILEKANTLLVCIPQHLFSSVHEFEVLKLVMRKAIMSKDTLLEARCCFLASVLFLKLHKNDEALPFVERLQFLSISLSTHRAVAPMDLNWMLCKLYSKKYLPHLALASLRLVPAQATSPEAALHKVELFIKNNFRLYGHGAVDEVPLHAQVTLYLKEALDIAKLNGDIKAERDLCLCLVSIFQQYKAFGEAVRYAEAAMVTSRQINEEEAFRAAVLLAWLHILNGQRNRAKEMLRQLLEWLHETDGPTQQGVVHNLLAICLSEENDVQGAARNFHWAVRKAQETGNKRNQALALANLGCLTLALKAYTLAEKYLLEALRLFAGLLDSGTDAEHVQVCLWLATCYADSQRPEDARLCYEIGLLMAMAAKNMQSQLLAAQALSCFYERVLPNHSCCILYYEHCLTLSQQLKNKQLEGSLLDILSELYLSLHAEKMYTTSLDYTKQSLRISIDLGMKDKEAKAWLRAGKTYYRMGEDELVEMYLQAAVQIAQKTKNTHFILRIYEEAGDVFYEGDRNRQMAINFYKDGAICLARSMGNLDTELRLVNKLVDLHVAMKQFEEALPHANLAVRLSSFTGDQLKERSSLHRLASVHFSLEQYELAENYYLKALSFTPLLLNKADQASYFAKVYYKLGQLTLHKLKDAFDASGYFQLALAAALEDKQAESLICTRLGEIYSSFLPDEEKAHFFFSNVQTLKMDTTVSDDTRLQQR
ncbi:SH3 domain and tetratricopeptide repeat-containing protein 2 isoform X1 [Polypterus senegalus]|nr:SH3 domain and tetratricopeptide repeat-containing protein 2 isoform X1 [Polypterus senegalus]